MKGEQIPLKIHAFLSPPLTRAAEGCISQSYGKFCLGNADTFGTMVWADWRTVGAIGTHRLLMHWTILPSLHDSLWHNKRIHILYAFRLLYTQILYAFKLIKCSSMHSAETLFSPILSQAWGSCHQIWQGQHCVWANMLDYSHNPG